MLDTDQLRSFLAIVDTGSFTRAAERVNKTQSAVSMQMRRLEEQLGRALFLKQGRGVRLSQDGERLVDHAREMLRVEATALAAMSGKALAGRVVLGLPDDYVDWLLVDVVKQFLCDHPLVELSIICDHSVRLIDRVAARELDLAVITASGGEVAPQAEILSRQRLSWIGGPRSCAKLVREGQPIPLALDGPTCCWRRTATAALDRAGMKYRFVVLSRSLSAITPIVEAGLALTVLPAGALSGDLRVVDEELGLPALPLAEIGLILRPGTPSRESNALADVIRRVTSARRGEAPLAAPRVAAE